MTVYCKTLNPRDYRIFHEARHVEYIERIIGMPDGHAFHPYRAWEYGLVLNVLRKHDVVSVLDVGGGGSVFAPAAAVLGMQVTEIDPDDYAEWVTHQAATFDKPIAYERCDFMAYDSERHFDAVTCLSVLEHVVDDAAFFYRLSTFVRPGGLLAVTVDFWPDGARHNQHPGQLRCYNEEMLMELVALVADRFAAVGPYDYEHVEPYVNDYTFASLVLQRKS